MKRTTRKMSETTKQRISAKLKGKTKSPKHKEAISKGMKRYWTTIPTSSNDNMNNEI